MKHLTDANKDKLLAFLRSRPAAGEASPKSWGRDQRPQIPGVLVEEIADALGRGLAVGIVRSLRGGDWWHVVARLRAVARWVSDAADQIERDLPVRVESPEDVPGALAAARGRKAA